MEESGHDNQIYTIGGTSNMKNKKVMLINSPSSYVYGGWVSLLTYPLGILALGSYLAAHDVPVELIDVQMDFGIGSTQDAEHIVLQRVAST